MPAYATVLPLEVSLTSKLQIVVGYKSNPRVWLFVDVQLYFDARAGHLVALHRVSNSSETVNETDHNVFVSISSS